MESSLQYSDWCPVSSLLHGSCPLQICLLQSPPAPPAPPAVSTTSTTSFASIPNTNRRSTDLYRCIYSRLWLFQINTAASETEAKGICLLRISLSFRVQQSVVPL